MINLLSNRAKNDEVEVHCSPEICNIVVGSLTQITKWCDNLLSKRAKTDIVTSVLFTYECVGMQGVKSPNQRVNTRPHQMMCCDLAGSVGSR